MDVYRTTLERAMFDPTPPHLSLTAQEEIDRIRAAYFDDASTAAPPSPEEAWQQQVSGWSGL